MTTNPNDVPARRIELGELNGAERVGAAVLSLGLRRMLTGRDQYTAVQAGLALLAELKAHGFTIVKE